MPTYKQNQNSSEIVASSKVVFADPKKLAITGPLEIGFTLDASGSMTRLFAAAATGYNAFVAEQQKLGPGAQFTFNTFETRVHPVHANVAIESVPDIDTRFLIERGGGATALLDGIGDAIKRVGVRFDEFRKSGRNPRAIIAILTDGDENSSVHFTRDQIFQMIHYRRTVYAWEFLFICADESGERFGLSLGIPKRNICRFSTNPDEIRGLMGRLSKAVGAYRLGDRNFAGYLTDREAK